MTTPSDTNKTDSTEIDSILEDLWSAALVSQQMRAQGKYKSPYDSDRFYEAKAALETIITQRCKESYKKGYIAAGIDGLKNE